MGERASVAQACMLRLELAMPTLLDDMENSTDLAYAALPERLYVVRTDGTVAYKSGPGPFGFDIDGWEKVISDLEPFIFWIWPIRNRRNTWVHLAPKQSMMHTPSTTPSILQKGLPEAGPYGI